MPQATYIDGSMARWPSFQLLQRACCADKWSIIDSSMAVSLSLCTIAASLSLCTTSAIDWLHSCMDGPNHAAMVTNRAAIVTTGLARSSSTLLGGAYAPKPFVEPNTCSNSITIARRLKCTSVAFARARKSGNRRNHVRHMHGTKSLRQLLSTNI